MKPPAAYHEYFTQLRSFAYIPVGTEFFFPKGDVVCVKGGYDFYTRGTERGTRFVQPGELVLIKWEEKVPWNDLTREQRVSFWTGKGFQHLALFASIPINTEFVFWTSPGQRRNVKTSEFGYAGINEKTGERNVLGWRARYISPKNVRVLVKEEIPGITYETWEAGGWGDPKQEESEKISDPEEGFFGKEE